VNLVDWSILIILLLVAGTVFFSVNVITLRTFSRLKLQEAFKASKKESDAETLTEQIAAEAETLILTCAVFRLFFNIAILFLLLIIFEQHQEIGLQPAEYIPAIITAVLIFAVFDLAIPHAWAKYAGEKLLSRTYRLLMFLRNIIFLLFWLFRACDGLVRRLSGIPQTTAQEEQEEKQEEFLNGLEQRRMEGVVDEEEQQMIENVLQLSNTTAGEIMTPRTDIVALEVNSDLQTVLDTINRAGHTRVPVYEDNIDNIIGLVYAKDLLTEFNKRPEDFNLRDKIREAYFVPETKPLRVLLHEFQNQKLHIAVVLDEYGGTAGIITLEDILEELVGEITDEYEKAPPEPVKEIDPNTFEVDAKTRVNDLNDMFDLDLPEDEDYDTIGGFVFSHLGYIPKSGETFDYRDLKFTILSAEPRRIRRLKIQKIPDFQA